MRPMSRCNARQVSSSAASSRSNLASGSSFVLCSLFSLQDSHPPSRNQSMISGNARASTRSDRILSTAALNRPDAVADAASTQARRKSPPESAAVAATASASRVRADSSFHAMQSLRRISRSCLAFAKRNASIKTLRAGDSKSVFRRARHASNPASARLETANSSNLAVRPNTTQSAAASLLRWMSLGMKAASCSDDSKVLYRKTLLSRRSAASEASKAISSRARPTLCAIKRFANATIVVGHR